MGRMRKSICVALLLCVCIVGSVRAAVIDGWSFDTTNAKNPLLFTYQGNTLQLLSGMGPVFSTGAGPSQYTTTVLGVSSVDGYTVMQCRAVSTGLSSVYYLKFKKLPDNAMEMLVEGNPNEVTSFLCGRIQGSTDYFKQFYSGQRMIEAGGHQAVGWTYASVYWPTGGLYFYGIWDEDRTNGYGGIHRFPPGANYSMRNPPISVDSKYGVLTDGSRPSLKERYVFRASTNIWESMGPVPNEPSEYGQELSEMVFFDHRGSGFEIGTFALNWLKTVTADRVKFYSVMQNWAAWNGWDTTNPDAWRIPDHRETWPVVGTNEQLRQFISIGKTLGRVGLRCNYLWIGPDSWSISEGVVDRAIDLSGQPAAFTDLYSTQSMAQRQEADIAADFDTTAVYHDQWGTVGTGEALVNFKAGVPGAGTLAATRQYVRNICASAKSIHNGPLGTEAVLSDFLIGKYTDTGDFQLYNVYNGNRSDFTPAYKLNKLHQLTTFHSIGIGPWFYYGPWVTNNYELGASCYFADDDKLDLYRSCEVLYGNAGYIQFTDHVSDTVGIRKVHALTECFTVGVAQRYYALQPVDYVKHGLNGQWKTLEEIIPSSSSLSAVEAWYKQFHIRYTNGCHVWVNRASTPLIVSTNDSRQFKLPQNGWLIYTEDGNLTAYTALAGQPEDRVDFCEDISRGIKYVNPRRVPSYLGVEHPTVWLDGQVHFVLKDPDATFYDAFKNRCGTPGAVYLPADISGPAGVSDCYVDLFDLSQMASQWLVCNDPLNSNCDSVTAKTYNFNNYAQMADWSIINNYNGALQPIGVADSWLSAGGVGGSGHVRMLRTNNWSVPSAKLTLNAYTFDKAKADISFSFAVNNPDSVLFTLGGASFFHAAQWYAGDAASIGGAFWFNPGTSWSNMAPFQAPTWGGAVWNNVVISITNGITNINVNGVPLVIGADWNGVLADTGNVFSFTDNQVSFVGFDDFAFGIPRAGVCGYLEADISGPNGVPDCRVNIWDFAEVALQWMGCNDPAQPASCVAN